MHDSRITFSELDLALIHALQEAPRASWAQIGRALDVAPTTAARRWDHLNRSRLAWLTAYDAPGTVTVAYIEVCCRPGRAGEVAASLAEDPSVFGIDRTAGDFDLFLAVACADQSSLGHWVDGVLGRLPGLRSSRTRLCLRSYGEGGDWTPRALEPGGRAELDPARSPHTPSAAGDFRTPRAATDEALLRALGENGRLAYTDLAARVGISEHSARRRLRRLVAEGEIVFRCDFARPAAGYAGALIYHAAVPHAELEATGEAVSRLAPVRLAVSVTGPHNLLVVVWLHSLNGAGAFESVLAERFPDLRIGDRSVVLDSPKRLGHLLDHRGRTRGRIVPEAAHLTGEDPSGAPAERQAR